MKDINLRVKKLETDFGHISDLQVTIGRLIDEGWPEIPGNTPFPSITTFRDWDRKLLGRYKPFYLPFCDLCCLCTFGKCDLTGQKRGACGITMPAQQSRIVLLAACIGAATHTSHARELVSHLIETYGPDLPINTGNLDVEIEAPNIRLVCGIRPQTLSDLIPVLEYAEGQLTGLLASTHTGQEGDALDFESKAFHAGMIDHVAMEVADIAQISALGFPKADPDAPLADLGMGSIDPGKPVILVIGHNVTPSVGIIDYLRESGLEGRVEVAGICCSAIDATRYSSKAKIIGPLSWQLRYIRSGIPDLLVVDEQCIRTDIIKEARAMGIPLIAASEKNCQGLADRSGDDPSLIVADLISQKIPGALILDPEKIGPVAVRTALEVHSRRSAEPEKRPALDLAEEAKKCTQCKYCRRSCPNDLHIPDAMKACAKGDLKMLRQMYDCCVGCGRCEEACPQGIPIHSMIVGAAHERMMRENFRVRTGRGAIRDVEIRQVGGPIVLGEIPGVVALVGCANYPKGGNEVAEMAMEFARRKFIVCSSGCAAISIGMYRDEDGKSPYEIFPGEFTAGGIVNVGSCVSNSHISGAAIKIASIFAKRNLRANYEEIADYVYNRVGAVGVAWGAMSQKAASIAAGFWRLGIPVIVGPHGVKYRRMLLGRSDHDEDWMVHDARTGDQVYGGPVPEHLFVAAETKEEAMMLVAKLSMRPNDTSRGRSIKLTHYLDLSRRFTGDLPPDLPLFVRSPADIPLTMKEDVLKRLGNDWKESPIPDPTLLPRLVRKKKEV
jgi:acetyl-CoA decarbonylase/synthase complex subunit alpha